MKFPSPETIFQLEILSNNLNFQNFLQDQIYKLSSSPPPPQTFLPIPFEIVWKLNLVRYLNWLLFVFMFFYLFFLFIVLFVFFVLNLYFFEFIHNVNISFIYYLFLSFSYLIFLIIFLTYILVPFMLSLKWTIIFHLPNHFCSLILSSLLNSHSLTRTEEKDQITDFQTTKYHSLRHWKLMKH